MPRPWFSIVGSGRSGTKYMATLMKANGLRCGHEDYFNPIRLEAGDQDEFLDGDSSWLAVPYLEEDLADGVVIHVARNPVAVIRSLLEIRFFHPETEQAPFPQFLRKHSHVFDIPDPLHRAVEFWLEWNTRARDIAHASMKLEDLDFPTISRLLDREISPVALDRNINHVPETLVEGRQDCTVTSQTILKCLNRRQAKFGY